MIAFKKSLLPALSSLTLAFALSLSSSSYAADNEAEIVKKLAGLGLKASQVDDTPVDNLKQVITDKGVFYVTSDNRYFIQGRLFDMDNQFENLTDNTLAKVRLDGLAKFNDSMIVFPAKQEKHQIMVFTDPTCGYCRKLHGEMAQYNDLGITVKYLAFPRNGLSSQAYQDMNALWCADDKQQAMTTAKAGGKASKAAKADCEVPLAEHFELGKSFGIKGTPAIILEDGTLVPGYKSPQALLKEILKTKA